MPQLLASCLALLLTLPMWGQTAVSGRVFDGESGLPLPFVNVSFAGSNLGTMTDVEGLYSLEAGGGRVTKLVVSTLGYQSQTIPIQRGVPQVINVALEARSVDLEAAVVRPDRKAKNPAKPLMQRVAEAKKENDPSSIPALKYDFYELLEVAVNDYPEKWPERKVWGPFTWVWDQLDSSEHRVALPMFATEMSGTMRTSNRRREKRIEAARATWLQDGENTASVQSEFLNINLYENQLLLLDRAFTSPLHDRGNVHYRYYILDTLDRGGRPCFHMAFVPRRRGELTFEGEMWIDTLSLGLRHVEAKSARVPTSTSSGITRGARRTSSTRTAGCWPVKKTWRTSAFAKVGWGFTATKPSSTTTSNRPQVGPTPCGPVDAT